VRATFPGTSVAGLLIFTLFLLLVGCSTDTGGANSDAASGTPDADRSGGATVLGGGFTHHTASIYSDRLERAPAAYNTSVS
jgi:hypothetical protein